MRAPNRTVSMQHLTKIPVDQRQDHSQDWRRFDIFPCSSRTRSPQRDKTRRTQLLLWPNQVCIWNVSLLQDWASSTGWMEVRRWAVKGYSPDKSSSKAQFQGDVWLNLVQQKKWGLECERLFIVYISLNNSITKFKGWFVFQRSEKCTQTQNRTLVTLYLCILDDITYLH